jgi:hypothetical protein
MTSIDIEDQVWDRVEDQMRFFSLDYTCEEAMRQVDIEVRNQIWDRTWSLARSGMARHEVVVRAGMPGCDFFSNLGPVLEQIQDQIKESG